MLILNRRPGEAIIIDGGIRIVVLQSDRRGVRLGFEAPDDTNIRREELVSEVAAENRRARAGQQTALDWAAQLPLRSPIE